MSSIRATEIPAGALLARYPAAGAYVDCYAVDVPATVTHAAFVEAFYTTWLFKVERFILRVAVAKPSSDADARGLAQGANADFAAWRVEDRTADQLLLGDFTGRTKSWLMVGAPGGSATGTRLYFGSAVVPVRSRRTGEARMGAAFGALLGFHKLYSRLLLGAAVTRLARAQVHP
jgi:hypothetical protein